MEAYIKKLNFITCIPDEPRFYWEIRAYLSNLREYEYSNIASVLIFSPFSKITKGFNEEWKTIQKEFPETKFFFYQDNTNFERLMNIFSYIPLLRLYMLSKHFKEFPNLKEEAVFYTDSDIIFLKKLDFTPFLKDEICYLSDTKTYISSDYFDSKIKDVNLEKIEEYNKRNVLKETSGLVGISKEVCVSNVDNSGGAQYLLKNIDYLFWDKVLLDCINIKTHLFNVNQEFMRGNTKEDKEINGFQIWCSDMWSLLWNLWYKSIETRCPKELNFAWSTDVINEDVYILHNAGVTSEASIRDTSNRDVEGKPISITAPAFFKGNYNLLPPTKEHLNSIIFHPISSKYFTSVYSQHLINTLYNAKR